MSYSIAIAGATGYVGGEILRLASTHPELEIGALCAFLASPFAAFISGTTLLVDGGRSALMQDA